MTVTTRRISFDETIDGLPKHFAGEGDLIASHLLAGLSAVFPDGEDFFVRSVRRHRDQVTDAQLKRDVAGFIGQESMHGREHRGLNDRLDALGYPSKRIERMTKRGLAFRERVTSAETCLAVTAALEHLTATFAEQLMTDSAMRDAVGPHLGPILIWHALEESEHKAVAFDVYRAAGGSERKRIRQMKLIRIGFLAGTVIQTIASMLGDRDTYRRGVLRASLHRLRTSPLLSKELLAQLEEYDRPGFHPNDRDTTELVERWRDQLFGDHGTLNHLLATAAA